MNESIFRVTIFSLFLWKEYKLRTVELLDMAVVVVVVVAVCRALYLMKISTTTTTRTGTENVERQDKARENKFREVQIILITNSG